MNCLPACRSDRHLRVHVRPPLPVAGRLPLPHHLDRLVIAHAATYGRMLTNFGARFAEKVVDQGGLLHFFASSYPVNGGLPPVAEFHEIGGEFHGLKIPQFPSPFLDLAALFAMAFTLRRNRVKILHTRSAKMSAIGALAGRLAGVPIIIHHQDDLYWRNTSLGSVKRWVVGKVEQALSTLVDKSLFISDAVLRDALRIGFRADKCVNVGIDLNPILLKAARVRLSSICARHPLIRNLGIPDSARIVGCIGRLVPEKGIDTLLRTAKLVGSAIPDSYFVIRGNGPLRSKVEAMIVELGLVGRAFLCTQVIPEAEVPDLYRSFDVFVLPTRREGFGMVFAEAMAFGVPVVGPNMAPVSEVVGPGCGALVEPENVEQYSAALRALLRDSGLRQLTGCRAREYALGRWGGDASANKVIQVYCDLISSKGIAADRCLPVAVRRSSSVPVHPPALP